MNSKQDHNPEVIANSDDAIHVRNASVANVSMTYSLGMCAIDRPHEPHKILSIEQVNVLALNWNGEGKKEEDEIKKKKRNKRSAVTVRWLSQIYISVLLKQLILHDSYAFDVVVLKTGTRKPSEVAPRKYSRNNDKQNSQLLNINSIKLAS